LFGSCIIYILYIYSTNLGTEYFKHAIYSSFFFSSKCSLFHNSNVFGSCIFYILYIYSTNLGTEYFKHGIYSPFFSLQNAVCFTILTCLVRVLFTFYIQGVLKLKKNTFPAPKDWFHNPFYTDFFFHKALFLLAALFVNKVTSGLGKQWRPVNRQLFSRDFMVHYVTFIFQTTQHRTGWQAAILTCLNFRWPCIVINSYNITNQVHYFLKFISGIKLYMFRTVPLSTIRSLVLYTQQWYMSHNTRFLTMDRKSVRNMWSSIPEINLNN